MTGEIRTPAEAVRWLMTPAAVRARANAMLAAAEAGKLEHFEYRPERLAPTVAYVLDTIRQNYPDLSIPFHSRWRHFAVGGRDRWAELEKTLDCFPPDEMIRARIDLAVTSVLLDAGAGASWRYIEPESGQVFARSEGLAVASLRLFRTGHFSSDVLQPLRADTGGLARFDAQRLAEGFQVSPDNPMIGVDGRARLLRKLGSALINNPDLFGFEGPRIGNIFDYFVKEARNGQLPARSILAAVLRGFGTIWPGRIVLNGMNLGDCWRHGAMRANDATDCLVPFHKLSQWLAYSLVEPLEAGGLRVTGLDEMTGLPEYRNGGLMLDMGVLVPRGGFPLERRWQAGDEFIVEWRALTVALLDRIADGIREALGRSPDELPLVKVLEGGTWAAGRRIARERRPNGAPPLNIESDGTVF